MHSPCSASKTSVYCCCFSNQKRLGVYRGIVCRFKCGVRFTLAHRTGATLLASRESVVGAQSPQLGQSRLCATVQLLQEALCWNHLLQVVQTRGTVRW
jgi:hypothetical protein